MNRHHARAPTRLADADRERQAAAIRAHDRRIARAAAVQRIARLAYCGILVAIVVIFFYSVGSY